MILNQGLHTQLATGLLQRSPNEPSISKTPQHYSHGYITSLLHAGITIHSHQTGFLHSNHMNSADTVTQVHVCLIILVVTNFGLKLTPSRDGPVKSAETRQGWKQKTILLQKIHGKERLEDYICCRVRQQK